MLFLINPLFLISFCCQKQVEGHTAPRTEDIGWDRLESPSVNILLTTKLLSLNPLSWDMDCLLTLWPLLIPCSLGTRLLYIWFSDLYHCWKKFLVQQPIYTHQKIIKAPLLHQSLGPRVCLSFFLFSLCLSLSFPLALSFTFLSLIWTARSWSIKGPQQFRKLRSCHSVPSLHGK